MRRTELTRSLDPTTLGLLGLTPLLAVCNTLLGGLVMGFAFLATLVLSALSVSCTRRFIPARSSLIYLLLVAAAWVSVIDLLMQAWFYPFRAQLGIYLYLLAMNTTVLARLETSSLRQRPRHCARACLETGLGGAALLAATGLLRELAAHGGLQLFATSAGAFIVFGLLLALLSRFTPERPASP